MQPDCDGVRKWTSIVVSTGQVELCVLVINRRNRILTGMFAKLIAGESPIEKDQWTSFQRHQTVSSVVGNVENRLTWHHVSRDILKDNSLLQSPQYYLDYFYYTLNTACKGTLEEHDKIHNWNFYSLYKCYRVTAKTALDTESKCMFAKTQFSKKKLSKLKQSCHELGSFSLQFCNQNYQASLPKTSLFLWTTAVQHDKNIFLQ